MNKSTECMSFTETRDRLWTTLNKAIREAEDGRVSALAVVGESVERGVIAKCAGHVNSRPEALAMIASLIDELTGTYGYETDAFLSDLVRMVKLVRSMKNAEGTLLS